MTITTNKQDDLWSMQVSLANSAAMSPNPSLVKFHHEILEEIGHRPSLELVKYFVGIAKIPKKEIEEYFQSIGQTIKEENTTEIETDPHLLLANNIASGDSPTILKFRQAFIKEYGEPPSDELTSYFLNAMQNTTTSKNVNRGKQAELNFVEKIASGSCPTILKLRNEFTKQYGCTPSEEVTQFFLKKIQENTKKKVSDEDYESMIDFTKTVANGHISTILHFRKAFEKTYCMTPSTEIVDIFIKNLCPTKGKN